LPQPRATVAVVVALLAIGIDIGVARLGYGLLLPAIRGELGGSYGAYGAIGAAHLAGYLGGTLSAPRWLRDRARVPRIIVLAHLVVAASLGASAAGGVALLGIARIVVGLASGVGIAAAITDTLERVPVARRPFASAVAWSGAGLGLIVSAPAGAWSLGDPSRWRVATLAAALAALALALIATRLKPHVVVEAAATNGDAPFAWRDVLRPRNAFFVGAYAAFGIAYISYATFAVAAFAARGLAPHVVAVVWSALGVATIAGALGIVPVLRGRSARFAFILPFVTGALGCWISSLPGVVAPIAGALCVGIGLAATPAVASAFARMRSDAATAALAFTAVTTVLAIGHLLGPLASGVVADHAGLAAVPLFSAAVFACGALCAAVDARLAGPSKQAAPARG
jgi:predicted MFS family arabinose efflux permease